MSRSAFVAAGRANHAVATLRRIVGASASGFHARLRAVPSVQARAEAEAELRAQGVRVGRKRVERLMRAAGLAVPGRRRRAPRTTDSRHDHPVAPNLLERRFAADRPDAVWLADIS